MSSVNKFHEKIEYVKILLTPLVVIWECKAIPNGVLAPVPLARKEASCPLLIIFDLEQARFVLSELGIEFNERQMKRAAEKDAHGRRKLPFFIDPIDKKLKINKNTLLSKS